MRTINDVNPETITKITAVVSAYVLFHSIESLKHSSPSYKGKTKEKCNEMLNVLTQNFKDDFGKIWAVDDNISQKLSESLEEIGKALALSKDPTVSLIIMQLLRSDLDFDKVKIVELKHKPKKK